MASGSVQPEKVVRFGPFETNLVTGETRKYGVRIRLGGQPAQILITLLETPGEVVTREELRRRLWAGDTFVEFENGMNNAVKKLRRALGDSADRPLYVETLPRVGYRFVAPIARSPETVVPAPENRETVDSVVEVSPVAPQRSLRLWRWVLAACLAAAAIVAYGFLSPAPVPRVKDFAQGTLSEHLDGFAPIVSDGVRVYFLERVGDHDNLVQTSTAGGNTTPVEAPFQNTRIFDVSPDRTEFLIGNFVARTPGLPLWIWPVQGGSPIRVGSVLADDAQWTPGAQQILYVHGRDIRIVRRDGTADRVLVQTTGYPHWIRFSPDGRVFTFTVTAPQSDSETLWEASADGANPHLRFPGWSNPPSECCAEWTPDGKYLVFSSLHSGFSNLWAVREKPFLLHWKAPRPVQLTPTARALSGSVLTRDGTRAFVTAANEAYEFVRYDFGSRQFVPVPEAHNTLGFLPSSDGAWTVMLNSDWTLWRSRPDGSARLQLTGPPLRAAQPRWSPDGTRIAFEAHIFGQPVRAYVVSADGGPVQEILAQKGEQGVPAWSPDGSTIAIAVNVDPPPDPAAPRGIYTVDWKTRNAAKLPGSDGLTSPMWSPDGKYFIAKTADERAILLFDHRTQKWNPIGTGTSLSGLTWSRDSRYLFVQKPLEPGQPIYRLRAGDFKPERVVSFESFLKRGIETCALQSAASDGSLTIRLRRGGGYVYTLDLDLP